MKLQHPEVPTPTLHGVSDTSGFTIQAGAEAFRILSSGLYSNPIEAIVRELSTNAWDGQVDNGLTDKPFDVSLPNPLSPMFIIRDYGVGMNHEEVMGLYSTYFGSNKTDDNTKIGALGLGSKSPLGYTNNFTVESIQQGVHNSYMIYLDDNGMPTIAHTGTMATDEADGITITIPTEDSDSHKWETAAQRIYKWFPTRPNFLTSDPRIPDRNEYSHEFNGIHSNMDNDDNTHFYDRDWHIIQGLIAYPLNTDQFDSEFFQYFGGEIHVEMGEVMFAPNRESITYNNRTVAAIQSYITQFDNEFMERKIAELDEFDDMITVLKLARNFRVGYNGVDKFPLMEKKVHDKFKELNVSSKFYDPAPSDPIYRDDGTMRVAAKTSNELMEIFYADTFDYSSSGKYHISNKYFLQSLEKHIDSEYSVMSVKSNQAVVGGCQNNNGRGFDHVKVILNDTKTGILGKARAILRDATDSNVLVFIVKGDATVNADMLTKFDALGYTDVVSASSVPDLVKPKSVYQKLQGTRFARLEFRDNDRSYHNRYSTVWNRGLKAKPILDEVTDKTRFWVTVKASEVIDFDRSELDKILVALGRSSVPIEIYGVKVKDAEAMKGLKGWKHFSEYSNKTLLEYFSKKDITTYAKFKITNKHDGFFDGIVRKGNDTITCPSLLALSKAHKTNRALYSTIKHGIREAYDHSILDIKTLVKVQTKVLDDHMEILYNVPTFKFAAAGYGFDGAKIEEMIELINHFHTFNTGEK